MSGGPQWANNTKWKTSAPLDRWRGVATDAEGCVTRVLLSRNSLFGGPPPRSGT